MKYFLILVSFLLFTKISYAQKQDSVAIKFEKDTHDFGDITQGQVVENVFMFTNTGIKPLVISNVITSCGCTAPTWPKDPIPPKGKAEIKIVFNSTGKTGKQNKVISIMSNAAGSAQHLTITANVLPAKQ